MSLNWDVADIKNWEQVVKLPVKEEWTAEQLRSLETSTTCWTDGEGDKITHYMNPITGALIWGTMDVGMDSITQENYHEFWMRLKLIDCLSDNRVRNLKTGETRSITLDEVRQHIGLKTNASRRKQAEVYARLLKMAEEHKRVHEEKLHKLN